MAEQTRTILKSWFETGDKPTEQQFADLIDSMLNLQDDGGAKVRQLLEVLTGLSRLKKSAVRGADFALNRRGRGDITSATFQSGFMVNVLRGDYWIRTEGETPSEADPIAVGDWIVALVDNAQPQLTLEAYVNSVEWEVIHFGDSSVSQSVVNLHHYRTSPTVETDTIIMSSVIAHVVSITVNKLTYYGKQDDGTFGNYDYVYRHVGSDTEIVINEDGLGFVFLPSMVVDVLYWTE